MRVLITESRRNSALICAKSLHRKGFELYGLDNTKLLFNTHSRYYRDNYIVPPYDDPSFPEALRAVLEMVKPHVLIPIKEVRWIFSVRELLEKHSAILLPDEESFLQLINKFHCYKLCRQFGVPCPEEYTVEEARQILRKNELKSLKEIVVIKPRLDFGGSKGLSYIDNLHDFDKIQPDTENQFGELIYQEYVPGPSSHMIALNLLYDRNHQLSGYFGFRKIRQYPYSGGITALGISKYEWQYVELVDPIFKKLKWVGPADVEFKLDVRDNTAKLMEINPRFTGALGFSYYCGVDFPLLYYEKAQGGKNGSHLLPAFKENIKWWAPLKYTNSVYHQIKATGKIFPVIRSIPAELKDINLLSDIPVRDFKLKFAKLVEKMSQ